MVTRRRVLRTGLTSAAAVGGTAAALRPMLTARGGDGAAAGRAAGGSPAGAASGGAGPADDLPLFDEVYRGRRIQGFRSSSQARVALYVDGRPLEVMRRVDGSWITMANHYQPYLTPLATARGAVDVIGRAQLAGDAEAMPGMDDGDHAAPPAAAAEAAGAARAAARTDASAARHDASAARHDH
jgi:hypothetical protein